MIGSEEVMATLRRACGDELSIQEGAGGEWFVELPRDRLVAAVTALQQENKLHHLSAISALKEGDELQVLYHLWLGRGLTLRVRCPADDAVLPSLYGVLPSANWYEREAHDLLGIVFEGHPNLKPLVLPEDWEGPPPLAKQS